MNAPNAEKAKRPLWVKIFIGLGGIYALYVIFGFFVIPIIMKNVLQGNVAETLDRRITLEKAAFNPFTLSVELTDLVVDDDNEKPFVEIGRLYTNPQLFPILTKRISVKEFALSDSIFRVEVDSSGELNFGQLLEGGEAKESEPAEPIHFTVTNIQVDNVRFDIADYTRTLALEESIGPISFIAENLKSDFDHDSPYHFEASFDEASTIEWSGGVTVNPIKSYGDISIQNIDISKAKPFWHDSLRAEIAGSFSFSGAYEFEISDSEEIAVLRSGSLSLNSVNFDDPENDVEASFNRLAIEGIEALWPDNRIVIDSIALVAPEAQLVRGENGEMLLPLRAGIVNEDGANVDSSEESETAVDVLVKSLTLSSGSVDLIDRSLTEEDTMGLRDVHFEGANVAPFDQGETAQLALSFSLTGGGNVEIDGQSNLASQRANGSLRVSDLELPAFQKYVSQYANALIESGKLDLEVEYNYGNSGETLDVDAALGIAALDIRDSSNKEPIFSFESLQVTKASYGSDSANIASIALENPVVSLALEDEGLNLSRITKAQTEESDADLAEEEVAEDAESLPIALSLERFSMKGGKMNLIDRTLDTAHQSSLGDLSMELENLSTVAEEPASISVIGAFDRGGSIRFEGELLPLDFKYNSAVRLDLSDFDLSVTAPYWKKYLGRGLDKGMLNVEALIDINESQLDGSNGIFIDQLTLGEKVESEDSLGLPIGLAVAILKDGEGKMELPPIKLSGDLDDPSVSISGIVMKALGNIIIKIATSPFAMLGNIAGAGGDEDLSKAPFEVGKFSIEGDIKSRLDKIAKILAERPGLKIEVSSIVAESRESELLRRAKIASKALSLSGEGSVNSDPIALLDSFDENAYEERLKSVYRDIMGLVVEEVSATPEMEIPEESLESKELEEESSTLEDEKGLWKNVARLLKNVRSQKDTPETKSEDLAETVEASQEGAVEAIDPPVIELPSIEEIEVTLFAREEFQLADSWLEQLGQERANRVKDYLTTTHGIEASRIFLSGETVIDISSKGSLAQFDLTD